MCGYHRQCAALALAPVAERPSALPPVKGVPPMAEPTLEYRLWQRGPRWHWQVMEVMDDFQVIAASGDADSSQAARSAAFRFCLKREDNHSAI